MTALEWCIFRAENSQQASCNWKITESHGESWQTTQQMQECTFHPVRRDCSREGSEQPDGKLSSQMPDICALFTGPEFTGGSVTAPAASRKCRVPCLVIQSLRGELSLPCLLSKTKPQLEPTMACATFFLWFPCFLQHWATKHHGSLPSLPCPPFRFPLLAPSLPRSPCFLSLRYHFLFIYCELCPLFAGSPLGFLLLEVQAGARTTHPQSKQTK